MRRERQLELLDRIRAHRQVDGSTDLVEASHREPVANYTDPQRYERERTNLFHHQPILAAMSCDIAKPGDYVTVDIDAVPIVVVRQDDTSVAAFRNVCRHRGACVADGKGSARLFTCPYHAWSYRRDGSLATVTSTVGFSDVDTDVGLPPIACDEAAGMVFVRLDGDEPLDAKTFMGPVFDDLEPFDLVAWAPFEVRRSERRMNWKLMYDTFGEAYHIGSLHKTTVAPMIRSDASTFDALGPHGLFIAARRSVDDLDDDDRDNWDLIPHGTLLYLMAPNSVFIYQQDHVVLWQIFPDAVDQCHAIVTLYAPQLPADERIAARWTRNLDLVMQVAETEDFIMCEQIQRSFSSGAQTHITFGRNEPGLGHFHRSVDALLGEGGSHVGALPAGG